MGHFDPELTIIS